MAKAVLILLTTASLRKVLSADNAPSCNTKLDCALNGDCVNGKCECDAAWSGSPDCKVMAFDALDKSAMPGYYNESASSWGGFPLKYGDSYALIHAQMLNSCTLMATWTTNSMVALSTSTSGRIEGPYAFKNIALPQFAHNPTVRQAADGTYVIYFIGGWKTNPKDCSTASSTKESRSTMSQQSSESSSSCGARNWPKSCGSDMPGPSNDTCGPADATYKGNAGCGISIATSTSLDGPWEVQPLKIVDQWRSDEIYCAHTNPSPVFLPNGTVVLAFNAGFCHGELETIGLAVADHYDGPYRLLEKNAVLRNPDGSPHHCEDPFLWKSERGWHLLTHNQQGPQGESSYAYSLDGHNWILSPTTPYNCTIHYTDGSSGEAAGCGNRPQIVFDGGDSPQAGPTPRWLINGALSSKPVGKDSWTLFRSIRIKKGRDDDNLAFAV